jgi:hypothetical protein
MNALESRHVNVNKMFEQKAGRKRNVNTKQNEICGRGSKAGRIVIFVEPTQIQCPKAC